MTEVTSLRVNDEEDYSNLYVLNKLAKKIDYSYILGMNQTKIIV